MIDFKNASYMKLKEISVSKVNKDIYNIIIDGENVLSAYQGVRDYVVFTDKRVISVNVQGMTGKKIDYTSMPYRNIVVFSIETAGTFDLDAELELWFSGIGKVKFEFRGIGKVKFEFRGATDIREINKVISSYVL